MRYTLYVILATFAAVFISPPLAYAYVGPGAGLSAIGSLFSLLGAIGLGIIGFIWYPVRRLLRRIHSRKPNANE